MLYNYLSMPLKPLSQVLNKYNKDKQPLEQLDMDMLHTAVSKKPPKRSPSHNSKGDEIIVRRDERGGRLPYRLADAGNKIIEAIRLGATYRLAAQYAGVQIGTIYNWINRAEKILARLETDEDPVIEESEVLYVDFFIRLQEAEGKAVVDWLSAIAAAAAEGKWQAAAWMLERRHPQEYGKRTEVHQHHTRGVATLEEWQQNAKKRRIEAAEVVREIEEIEDVDYRILGKPAPSEVKNEN